MNLKTLAVNDYIFSLPYGMADPGRVDALYEVIQRWQSGEQVYVYNAVTQKWDSLKPVDPMPNTAWSPAVTLPDWTCGCGCTLHGDEKTCWRCGAPKRP